MTFRKYTALLLTCAVISSCGLNGSYPTVGGRGSDAGEDTVRGTKPGSGLDLDQHGTDPLSKDASKRITPPQQPESKSSFAILLTGLRYGKAGAIGACEGAALALGGRTFIGSAPHEPTAAWANNNVWWKNLIFASGLFGAGRRVYNVYSGTGRLPKGTNATNAEQREVNEAFCQELQRLGNNQDIMLCGLTGRFDNYKQYIERGAVEADLHGCLDSTSETINQAKQEADRSQNRRRVPVMYYNPERSNLFAEMVRQFQDNQ